MLPAIILLLPFLLIFVLAIVVVVKKRRAKADALRADRLRKGNCLLCGVPLPGPVFAAPGGGYIVQCAGIAGCGTVLELPSEAGPLLAPVRRRTAEAELRADGYSPEDIQAFLDDDDDDDYDEDDTA
jgi:hypothetical protein